MQIWKSVKSLLRFRNLSDRNELTRMERILQAVREDQQRVAPQTLANYLILLSGIPLPSAQQKNDFAQFLSTAHSWYKHLPPNLPGEAFYLYLDRYAGCDRLLQPDGTAVLVERKERGFHYSDLPTAEYRDRFGYLSFSSYSGTSVFVSDWPVVSLRDKVPAVPADDGKMLAIPVEIVQAGETHLTAIIHPGASCYPVCHSLEDWPEESGGRVTLEKINARCREMEDPTNPDAQLHARTIGYTDPLLDELVVPERRRQQRGIVQAIDRVCEVIRVARAEARLSQP